MTVRELIETLEQIEDKELDVVINDDYNEYTTDIEVIETNKYYGKSESPYGWVSKTRKCVILV